MAAAKTTTARKRQPKPLPVDVKPSAGVVASGEADAEDKAKQALSPEKQEESENMAAGATEPKASNHATETKTYTGTRQVNVPQADGDVVCIVPGVPKAVTHTVDHPTINALVAEGILTEV